MRTPLALVVILVAVVPFARGQEPARASAASPDGSLSVTVLGRAGGLVASDATFRSVYGAFTPVVGAEARVGISALASGRLQPWFEASYRRRSGELTFTKEPTKVRVVALEGGLHYRILRGNVVPYVAGGIGYYLFEERNEAIGTAREHDAGFCVAGGVAFLVGPRLVIDGRAKFNQSRMQPTDLDVNVGGLAVDIGVGIRF